MNRNLRRLLIAFTVSCACYFGTWFWYQKGKTASADNSNSKPIARLQSHINEVQRKPIARVIWENISKNETLFVGETIRTSANSEATISFLGTNTMIELEPDSMIALEEGQGSFALNFLKGNMFLRKKEGDVVTGEEQKELVVKVGNNKVNLSNAEVSLSKKGKGPVDLQVFSGQAKVDNQGKTVTLDKSTIGKLKEDSIEKDKVLIEIISPQANSEMYSEPSQLKNVTFTWKPIDDNYEMKLRWGHNRKSFNKQVTTSVAAKDGKITQSVRPGKLYWQLEAIPKDPNQASVKSPIYKNKIIPKKGTILLEPKNQEKITFRKKDDLVPFSWTHQMELVEPTLQISEDPQFKKVILTKNLEENESNFSFNIPRDGRYYWRIFGKLQNNTQESISSKINSFTVFYKQKLPPPVLTSPEIGFQVTDEKFKENGLMLSWETVMGAQKYKVLVWQQTTEGAEPDVSSFEVANPPYRLQGLNTGAYLWSVVAVDDENQESNPAKQFSFSILDLPEIAWEGGVEPSEYFYLTGKPSLYLRWLSNPKINATQWRYRLKRESKQNFTKWYSSNKLGFNMYLPEDGRYEVQLEALNQKNEVIGRARTKEIHVKQRPLLPGPQFAEGLPEVLQSDKRGRLEVSWKDIDGAQKYRVEVLDKKGKVYKSAETDRNIASLNRLRPGSYTVKIQAVDKYKRLGESSEVKQVVVPKKSSIRAPKLKGVKVK